MIDGIIKIMTHDTMPQFENKKICMFSATKILNLSVLPNSLLESCKILTIGEASGACPDILQRFLEVNGCNRRDQLEKTLSAEKMSGTIIFVNDVAVANNLIVHLRNCNINAAVLHSERSTAQREQSLREFQAGLRDILVATPAIGRGLGTHLN